MGTKINGTLGEQVRDHLIKLGLENPDTNAKSWGTAHKHMQDGVQGFLRALNLVPDPSRDDTSTRVADMFIEDLCWGLNYDKFPKCTTTPNGVLIPPSAETQAAFVDSRVKAWEGKKTADEIDASHWVRQHSKMVGKYDQMVRVTDIQTISLCEHHFQTIYGVTHIAYIPGAEVLGLSKFARVTEFFARRPQIQERMTEQIAEALAFILKTDDVAVVVDAEHFCMKARGAMQHSARTRTDKMKGRFLSNPSLRQEFLHGIK